MRTKIKLRVMTALIVMLAASINAEAQLGGALNRARRAVEQTTKETTKETEQTAKDAAKQKAPETPQTPVTQQAATTQPAAAAQTAATPQQQGGKPSAEAIAADPRASVTTVEEGYTKSPAEIRAAYEILGKGDPDYPNRAGFFFPYYHPYLKKYYYLTDSKEELDFFTREGKSLDAHRSKGRQWSWFKEDNMSVEKTPWDNFVSGPEYIMDTIPAGNRTPWGCLDDCIGIMPAGIHVIFAGYALFLADPEGLKPFMRLCEAENAATAYGGSINITGGNDGRTLNSRPEKLTVKWEHATAFTRNYSGQISEAIRTKTPMSVIRDAATYYKNEVAKYDAAKDITNTRYYYHLFEVAMAFWYGSGPKKTELAAEMDALFVEYVRYAKRYNDWHKASQLDAAPIEMPRTYTMTAALAAKALEVAKSQFEKRNTDPFKVDRIVFLTDKWSEAREQEWPNRVVTRTIQVGVLTNQDGKWIMRQWTLQQDSDLKGGFVETYRYVAGNNYQPKPVNYKP